MSARRACDCCGRVRDIMSLECIENPNEPMFGVLVCEDRYGCMHLHRPVAGPFSYRERRLKAKSGAALTKGEEADAS